MECQAVVLLLWEYLDEELGPEEARSVGAHLVRCGRCYPAYCCDRAFLQLLARQRTRCAAPAVLMDAIRDRLGIG